MIAEKNIHTTLETSMIFFIRHVPTYIFRKNTECSVLKNGFPQNWYNPKGFFKKASSQKINCCFLLYTLLLNMCYISSRIFFSLSNKGGKTANANGNWISLTSEIWSFFVLVQFRNRSEHFERISLTTFSYIWFVTFEMYF